MPKSRFPFSLTFLVAAGLILGFHSSPYFVMSPHSLVAQTFTPGGAGFLSPEEPSVTNPFESAPVSDGMNVSDSNFNTMTGDEIFNSQIPQQGSGGTQSGSNFVNMDDGSGSGFGSGPGGFGSDSSGFGSGPGGFGSGPDGGGGGGFTNPLKYDNIEDFLYALLGFVIQIGYVVAVFFIILSGFYFVMAQGNTSKIESAREMLTWTIIGTAVLIGAQVIAAVIKSTIDAIGAGGGV